MFSDNYIRVARYLSLVAAAKDIAADIYTNDLPASSSCCIARVVDGVQSADVDVGVADYPSCIAAAEDGTNGTYRS